MVGSAITAKKHWDHALRIREAAKVVVSTASRAGMLSMALDYEHLAKSIESATTRRKLHWAFCDKGGPVNPYPFSPLIPCQIQQ
jgi:hypothetical protein